MSGCEQYQKMNVATAGKLKSHQLLLERAIVLVEQYGQGDRSTQVKIQNILSQLQMSTEIAFPVGRDLHRVFAVLWDVVATGSEEGILGVGDVLRTHLETLLLLQGKELS